MSDQKMPPPPPPDTPITVAMTIGDAELVADALADRPYREVYRVMNQIERGLVPFRKAKP